MQLILRSLAMLALTTAAAAGQAPATKPVGAPPGAAIPKDMTPYFVGFLVKGEKVIMTAKSADDARGILEQDPEYKAGHVGIEIHPALFPSLAGVKISY